MKRLTIRADEVRVGDTLHDCEGMTTRTAGQRVRGVFTLYPHDGGPESIEIWAKADPDHDLPDLTLAPSDQVEVWR